MMIIIDEALKRDNGTLRISEVQELLGVAFIEAESFNGYGGLYSKEKTIKIMMAVRI
jgi:hypothetical protein